jgi:hypothetical protein
MLSAYSRRLSAIGGVAVRVITDAKGRGMRRVVSAVGVCAAVGLLPQGAGAQAFNYPSLQLPTASTRDYTGALVGGTGTTALFQWREGWTPTRHWQLDLGMADRKHGNGLMLFAGAFVGQELTRATDDQPLDLMFTVGGGAAFGDGVTLIRVPVGLSLGHTFELEQGMSLTPYLHPRLSFDSCSSCSSKGRGKSEVSLSFDVGVNYQVNREFAVRLAGSFSGSDLIGTEDTFGIGLNWTPAPLIRTR